MDGRRGLAIGGGEVVVEEEEAAVLGGVGDEAVLALDVEEELVERGGRVRREEAQAREVERAAARERLLAERAEGVGEAVFHLGEDGGVVLGRLVEVDDVEGLDHRGRPRIAGDGA